MFVWVRPFRDAPALEGDRQRRCRDQPCLALTAMMLFLTQKPYLVVAAVGLMFAANDKIRDEKGWAYYRLCFAAESEENIDLCTTLCSGSA